MALLSNYKVIGSFAINPNKSFETTMILDTGAGPSCMKTAMLPAHWEKEATMHATKALQAANGKPLACRATVPLFLRFGDYIAKDRFLVVDDLPVAVLLGAGFQDTHLSLIKKWC